MLTAVKVALWTLMAVLIPSLGAAQSAREIGVGLTAGDVIGASGKLWLDKFSALDLAMGQDISQGNFAVYGDFLYHGWKAFPQPSQGRLAAYVGGGPRIEAASEAEFGLRLISGASYWLEGHPLELFAELGPFFRMAPDGGVYVVGGVGLRYYFKSWN